MKLKAGTLVLMLLVPAIATMTATSTGRAPTDAPHESPTGEPVVVDPALVAPSSGAGAAGAAAGAVACDAPLAGFPCNVDTTSTGVGNELHVAINPLDTRNVIIVSKDYALSGGAPACSSLNVWTGYYVTKDGGATWLNGHAPGHPGDDQFSPISSYPCSTDPVIGFGPGGTAYMSGLAISDTASTSALWVAKSVDGGVTWNGNDLHVADETNFNDKNWMAVDPVNGHVYVTWTLFNTGSGIYFKRALDGDLSSWGPRVRLCSTSCGGSQGSYPVVGPNGEVYVVWTTAISGGSGSLRFVKSTNNGATFTAERAILNIQATAWSDGNAFRTPSIPAMAVNHCACPQRGHLYVAWQDSRSGDSDILLSRSTDGGESWSPPVRVNDDPMGTGRDQYFPALDVDDVDGSLHVLWYDKRDHSTFLNAYYASSDDGGATWTRNVRLSTVSSDPQYSKHQSGATFVGDYLGIAAHDGIVRPAWTDTRHRRADVFTVVFPSKVPTFTGRLDRATAIAGEPVDGALDVAAETEQRWAVARLTVPRGVGLAAPGATVATNPDGSSTATWDLGRLLGSATLPFTLTPRVTGTLDVRAALAYAPVEGDAGVLAWASTLTVRFPPPVTGVEGAPRVVQGSVIEVTLRARNTAAEPLTGAKLILRGPADATLLPEALDVDGRGLVLTYPSGITMGENGIVTWQIGTLAESAEITLRYQAPIRQAAMASPFAYPRLAWEASLTAGTPDGKEVSAAASLEQVAVSAYGASAGEAIAAVDTAYWYAAGL